MSTILPNWFEYIKHNFVLLPDKIGFLVLQIGAYKADCTEYILQNGSVK